MCNSLTVNGRTEQLLRVQENASSALRMRDLSIVPGLLVFKPAHNTAIICHRKPLAGVIALGFIPKQPTGPESTHRIYRNDYCDIETLTRGAFGAGYDFYTTLYRFSSDTFLVRVQRKYVLEDCWYVRTSMHRSSGWCQVKLPEYCPSTKADTFVLRKIKLGYLHIQGPDYYNAYHCVL